MSLWGLGIWVFLSTWSEFESGPSSAFQNSRVLELFPQGWCPLGLEGRLLVVTAVWEKGVLPLPTSRGLSHHLLFVGRAICTLQGCVLQLLRWGWPRGCWAERPQDGGPCSHPPSWVLVSPASVSSEALLRSSVGQLEVGPRHLSVVEFLPPFCTK